MPRSSSGSGGARGYAHIGALQVLRERDFDVVAIAGTSHGRARRRRRRCRRLDEYTEWSLSLTQREVWRLLDLSLSATGGAIRAERIIAKVDEILGALTIDDLPIPYTAVATDLAARREVWFQHGPVIHAIRASIAIPGVITPAVINGRTLVDGGLINPVPIEPTTASERRHHPRHRPVGGPVAVEPCHSPEGDLRAETPGGVDVPPAPGHHRGPRVGTDPRPRQPVHVGHRREPSDQPAERRPAEQVLGTADIGVVNLLAMSFETMSSLISRYRMASNPPDILVTVPSNAVGTLDFHRAAEMIELGRKLTTEALDRAGY